MFVTFRSKWEASQPPGAAKKVVNTGFQIALRYRDALWRCLKDIDAEVFDLDRDAVNELAVAVTGMAEDLHADAGLWRSLEKNHTEFFGVPLPLLCRPGDAPLETFDVRRFQFFFYSVWQHFRPGYIISPTHRSLEALAQHAHDHFNETFAPLPCRSSTADFLVGSNNRGWEVKRKLIWLGTQSFLFRFAFQDYMKRQKVSANEQIPATDDFLCQQSTQWSGLGALDILADVLDLPDEDRAVLRNWHERHVALYKITSFEEKGTKLEVMHALNLINDQPYRIRMEQDLRTNPFRLGMYVFGSLVPWRSEWYWSGTQQVMKLRSQEVAATRKRFRKNGNLTFRYCPDLEKQAREIMAEHFADFTNFYGSDLAVFTDGLTAAAAEQKRMRIFSEAKSGKDLEKLLRKHGLKRPGQGSYPEDFLQSEDGVAVFHHEVEGAEMFTGYGPLLSGLNKRAEPLTQNEMDAIQAFIESDITSVAFVRRVIRETGNDSIEKLYYLPEGSQGLEYLLRRFKGCYYRKRYPNLSLLE